VLQQLVRMDDVPRRVIERQIIDVTDREFDAGMITPRGVDDLAR
jgi:hypothetical protein